MTHQSNSNIPFFFLIGFTIVLFMILFRLTESPSQERTSALTNVEESPEVKAKQLKETSVLMTDLYEWPLPPPPKRLHRIAKTAPPDLNFPLPSVRYNGNDVYRDSLTARVNALIANHPSEEIRVELAELIKSGEIKIRFNPEARGSTAQFLVKLKRTPLEEEKLKFEPTIFFNYLSLMRNLNQEDKLFYLLVLYHEFVHYKQYKKAQEEDPNHARVFFANYHPSSTIEGFYILKDEMEAYEKEMDLLRSWGIRPTGNLKLLMDYVHTEEFGHLVFLLQTRSSGHLPPPLIMAGMAEAAGHPYPDIYLYPR